MAEDEPKHIIWVDGIPYVDGDKAPPETTSDNPIEQQLLDDVAWEAEQKAKGITGLALTKAFLKRLGENDREEKA